MMGIAMLFIFSFPVNLFAQRIVKGTLVDSTMSFKLPSANAVIYSIDSTFIKGTATDTTGQFKIKLPDKGAYLLRFSMVGYKTIYYNIKKGKRKEVIDLDTIAMKANTNLLKGVEVKGALAEMETKEDTISFNASSYDVQEGDALEELIKQLPGIEVDGDKITYNGKDITEFRVNGKDFFKGKKEMAMKNLPVDLVKAIKTYEKKSDYAEQTGIDDGKEETIMDIELKQELNETWITNYDGAVGSYGRYINKLFANRITDLSRLTISGNMKDEDARSTQKHIGFDFNSQNKHKKKEGKHFEIGGNVGFGTNHSHEETWKNAENFIGSNNQSSFNNSNNYNKNKNKSFGSNIRIEWNPDTMTTVTARNSLSFGNSQSYSRSRSAMFNKDPFEISPDDGILDNVFSEDFSLENMPGLYPITVNRNSRESKRRGHNFSHRLNAMVVRRLGTKGRNITFDLNTSVNNGKQKSFNISDIYYYNAMARRNRAYRNQYNYLPNDKWNINTRLSYNEPLFKGGFLQTSYRFERSHSRSDRSLYELDSLDGWRDDNHELGDLPPTQDSLDMALNILNSTYSTYNDWNHSGNLSFRINNKKLNLNIGTGIHRNITHLDFRKNKVDTMLVRKITRFTPMAFFKYRLTKRESFDIRYDGWSSEPSMQNRLNIVDNSNPLHIYVSNSGLKPAWNNRVRLGYKKFIVERQQNYSVNANFNQSSNNISTAIFYDNNTGVRTTMPKNINGNWSANLNFTFSTSLDKSRRFHLSNRLIGGYNNSVGYVNSGRNTSSEKNLVKTTNIGDILNLRYQNKNIRAKIGGRIKYRHSDNRLRPKSNLNSYDYSYFAEARFKLPWKMTVGSNITMQSRRGYSNHNMNTDELLWNAEISQNFLKGSPLIVKLRLFDILQNRSNVRRIINAHSRIDSQTDASYSYFMLHAILRLNIFNGKISSGFLHKGKKKK